MEFIVLDIALAIILVLLVVYNMIMIGLMSSQTYKVDNNKSEVSERRSAIKTKYNIA